MGGGFGRLGGVVWGRGFIRCRGFCFEVGGSWCVLVVFCLAE